MFVFALTLPAIAAPPLGRRFWSAAQTEALRRTHYKIKERTMALRQKLTAQALLLWRFLGFFQPPTLRLLHAVAAVLVILKFCTKLFGFGYRHVVLG